MNEYAEFIGSVLQEASRIASDSFGKVTGTTKPEDNNQVLTQTDIEIGNLVIARIGRHYTSHNIIDEEAGVIDNGSRYTWMVDPIDGTSNFASGVPTYGIMIGLLDGDAPVAGGVALPYQQEIYVAVKGGGAYCNNQKIAVSTETELRNVLVAYGIDGHPEEVNLTRQEMVKLGDIIVNVRNIRSSNSVFDQMLVARGKYGGALNQTSKIWDNVAQQIIIEEAGGMYTDFNGRSIDYSQPLKRVDDNFTFCAAAPALHQQLMRVIQSSRPFSS